MTSSSDFQGIDVRSMNRIFVGLVRCGAWGCFDEFNRLDEQVLSAVATDIQLIQVALRARSTHVHLLGHQVTFHQFYLMTSSLRHHRLKLIVIQQFLSP